MQALVDRHEAGGIVTLIAREGKVVDVHASGFQDVESRTPMRTDTLFRIASMTKPMTSVAVMMLYEEGKLLLTDPVSKFIPAFKGQQVQPAGPEAPAEPVAARRDATIRDLLSHRSGLTYGFLNGGAVGNAYRKNDVPDGLAADLAHPGAGDGRAGGAAARQPAGRGVQLQPVHRRARPRRRGRVGAGAGRVLPRAHFHAAGHERHRLRGARRPSGRAWRRSIRPMAPAASGR